MMAATAGAMPRDCGVSSFPVPEDLGDIIHAIDLADHDIVQASAGPKTSFKYDTPGSKQQRED